MYLKISISNKLFRWTYNGVSYRSTKGEIFSYLSDLSQIPGYDINLSEDKLKKIFGKVYDEWISYGGVNSDASRFVEGYISYIDGSAFDLHYSWYKSDKASEALSEQMAKDEEARIKLEKEDEAKKELLERVRKRSGSKKSIRT